MLIRMMTCFSCHCNRYERLNSNELNQEDLAKVEEIFDLLDYTKEPTASLNSSPQPLPPSVRSVT